MSGIVDGILKAMDLVNFGPDDKVEYLFQILEQVELNEEEIFLLTFEIAERYKSSDENQPPRTLSDFVLSCREHFSLSSGRCPGTNIQIAFKKIAQILNRMVVSRALKSRECEEILVFSVWLYDEIDSSNKGSVAVLLRNCGFYFDFNQVQRFVCSSGSDCKGANLIAEGIIKRIGVREVLENYLNLNQKPIHPDCVNHPSSALASFSEEEIKNMILNVDWNSGYEVCRARSFLGELKQRVGEDNACRWAKEKLPSIVLPDF